MHMQKIIKLIVNKTFQARFQKKKVLLYSPLLFVGWEYEVLYWYESPPPLAGRVNICWIEWVIITGLHVALRASSSIWPVCSQTQLHPYRYHSWHLHNAQNVVIARLVRYAKTRGDPLSLDALAANSMGSLFDLVHVLTGTVQRIQMPTVRRIYRYCPCIEELQGWHYVWVNFVLYMDSTAVYRVRFNCIRHVQHTHTHTPILLLFYHKHTDTPLSKFWRRLTQTAAGDPGSLVDVESCVRVWCSTADAASNCMTQMVDTVCWVHLQLRH